MLDLQEIEELIKAVHPNAIREMLRNAAILNDPNATEDMKNQALDSFKAVATNKKIPKSNQPEAPIAAAAQPAPAQPVTPQIEYPQGLHQSPLNTAGHDEEKMKGIFHALPDHEKKAIVDWHAASSTTPVNKSIDSLYALFQELKKRI